MDKLTKQLFESVIGYKIESPELEESFLKEDANIGKADRIMDVLIDVLKQDGYNIEDVHLMDYNTWKPIERDMERELWSKHLDLSFTSDYAYYYGVELSGNSGGIINGFRQHYCMMHPDYGWTESRNVNIDSASGFYEEDRYGFPNKISKERFIQLITTQKSSSRIVGYGSQSSVDDITIDVYTDNYGNLMFSKSFLKYD